jgi:dienelactone hydrolase
LTTSLFFSLRARLPGTSISAPWWILSASLKASIAILASVLASAVGQTFGEPAVTVETAEQEIAAVVSAGGAILRVRVFRPPGDGPFPLAIVNHGSPASASDRPTMPLPTFASASNWLLEKKYLIALPLRRGYGLTGGVWAEAYGGCGNPDYYRAGLATAEDIRATLAFFRARGDVARERALVIGYSAGGRGSLALASTNPDGVRAVINFAGGRGGMQPNVPNCMPERLVDAANRYGATARIPSLWLYAVNDTFFSRQLSKEMFDAFVHRGGIGAPGIWHQWPFSVHVVRRTQAMAAAGGCISGKPRATMSAVS